MAKSNAAKCKTWRAKQLPKLALPMPEGTRKALDDLMKWHGFEDEREAVATMLHRLHDLGEEGSRELFKVSRHQFDPSPEQVERLQVEGARARGDVVGDWR